jgi:thymidylate synthase (FAD)
MKATLIEYTGKGRGPWAAAELMIFTKNTRIKMGPDGLEEIASWPEQRKLNELDYMSRTIPSSWEFVDYVFMIEDVTRALTHQLVRTRTASYAQQTQQILDVRGFSYEVGPSLEKNVEALKVYTSTMEMINAAYAKLLDMGVEVEDARGLLPTHIHTNIVMKANLRTYNDLIKQRVSPRNYGAMSNLAKMIKAAILEVHPWASLFLSRSGALAMDELDIKIMEMQLERDKAMPLHKLIDEARRTS